MIRSIPLLYAIVPAISFAAVPVTTAPLASLLQQPSYSAPANVVAQNSPNLSAEINARIDTITVRVGDRVEKGALLVKLDCRQYESTQKAAAAGLEQLRVQKAFAATQFKRADDLKKSRGISDESVDQRRSELDSLSAQLSIQQEALHQAELQTEHCEIRAPFNAVVIERVANVGSLATIGTSLLKLVQTDDIEVSARLMESELESLTKAVSASFEYLGNSYPITLRKALPVVDERTHSREVRFLLDSDTLPVGGAGRVQWQDKRQLLSAEYLVRRNSQLGFFHVKDGKAHFQQIADALEGQAAYIDLPGETEVIIEGRQRLVDNDQISIINEPAAAPAPAEKTSE